MMKMTVTKNKKNKKTKKQKKIKKKQKNIFYYYSFKSVINVSE